MLPAILRHSRSERSIPKLKKGNSPPQVFPSRLADDAQDRSQSPDRRMPRTTARNVKRDTILIDLSNNDLIPALDYAFAILEDDQVSSPPASPDYTPSTSTTSIRPSPRSSPPRYYVPSPLGSSPNPSPESFDPEELSFALAQATSSPDPVPFPPPAAPPAARVPLLLRKPRFHSPESSIDGHDPLYHSYPGSSKVSLVRSVSSLGHHRDVFGARSTLSLHSPDPALSALLAQQPSPSRGPYGSLRLFSKKHRPTPIRRASSPPPSSSRLAVPTARPPVPALPESFLLGSAARRQASSTSPSLRSRAVRAHNPS